MLLILLALLAVVAAFVFLLARMRRSGKEQLELMQRIRSSRVYEGLYPMLCQCGDRPIDEVIIHPEGVTVSLLCAQRLHYGFEEHGIDPLSPDSLLALAQAVVLDLPALQDSLYYQYEPRKERLPGGERVTFYTYTLRHDRKDYLLRHHHLHERDR